ncbi:unnamed protein product [Vitrella brassicaformis CCMP3155]|uniref:MYND-type domain-containing protein n=1 Tax=Vitrella brassicaformis (strain CCMP3155) TaxID=1169540 RepID=A0A0G4GQV5_VITBC|nr:unnamed protein product [Vitrella brassicaformis CCMP3155]|eukprot:CEM32684.1 unnamed protein product [Vitrella brassicaformis CCMP3155]
MPKYVRPWEDPPTGADPRPSSEEEDLTEEEFQAAIQERINRYNRSLVCGVPRRTAPDLVSAFERNRRGKAAELLTIRVEMTGVRVEGSKIWRRLRVRSDLNLAAMHKKVLVPAMGWAPDYHGYGFFRKPYDRCGLRMGVAFGPTEMDDFIDLMHTPMQGIEMQDARRVQLGDLFTDGRSEAVYVYDLGDFFIHSLVLERRTDIPTDTTDTDNSSPIAAELLDGANACPPEDCHGSYGYAEMLDKIDDARRAGSRRKLIDAMAEGNHAVNYPNHDFHPTRFDLTLAQSRVKAFFKRPAFGQASAELGRTCACALCRRRAGLATDGKMAGIPIMRSGGGEADAAARQMSNLQRGNAQYFGRQDGIACCAFCLDRERPFSTPFMRCSRCKRVYYCSVECQRKDWGDRHKQLCKPATTDTETESSTQEGLYSTVMDSKLCKKAMQK